MHKNILPNFKNNMIFRYGLKFEWHIPSQFTTIQAWQIFMHKLVLDRFLLISHFCSSLLSFCLTQGDPTKTFGTHSNICPINQIKEKFNQGPHAYISFYMLLFL
jgi:hypothetical protein